MSLKEKYLSYWSQKRYQFQYHPDHFNKDMWDYAAVEATCEKIKVLKIGDTFKFGKNNFVVRDKNERYVIATTKSGKTYTIIDTVTGVCGPSDRTFLFTDFTDIQSIRELLAEIKKGDSGLSYRNSVPVNMYIVL